MATSKRILPIVLPAEHYRTLELIAEREDRLPIQQARAMLKELLTAQAQEKST